VTPSDPTTGLAGAAAGAPQEKRGGLLLRAAGDLFFLPAALAVSIDPPPSVVRVPGAPPEMLGIAAHAGEVLPVVALGEDRSAMVVCRVATELLGIVGATIVGAGLFDGDPSAPERVRFLGESARPLDLPGIYAKLQGGAWAGRWGG